jgi:hypothetical protein
LGELEPATYMQRDNTPSLAKKHRRRATLLRLRSIVYSPRRSGHMQTTIRDDFIYHGNANPTVPGSASEGEGYYLRLSRTTLMHPICES